MISTFYELDGTVVIHYDGAELALTRQEAELLFVQLGHTLQDQDVMQGPFTHAGTDDDQPD